MSLFVDIVMLTLFILFMIFIFGGYHKNKSAQRETDEKKLKNEVTNILE